MSTNPNHKTTTNFPPPSAPILVCSSLSCVIIYACINNPFLCLFFLKWLKAERLTSFRDYLSVATQWKVRCFYKGADVRWKQNVSTYSCQWPNRNFATDPVPSAQLKSIYLTFREANWCVEGLMLLYCFWFQNLIIGTTSDISISCNISWKNAQWCLRWVDLSRSLSFFSMETYFYPARGSSLELHLTICTDLH